MSVAKDGEKAVVLHDSNVKACTPQLDSFRPAVVRNYGQPKPTQGYQRRNRLASSVRNAISLVLYTLCNSNLHASRGINDLAPDSEAKNKSLVRICSEVKKLEMVYVAEAIL